MIGPVKSLSKHLGSFCLLFPLNHITSHLIREGNPGGQAQFTLKKCILDYPFAFKMFGN